MRWSEIREAKHGGRWHLWAELVDEDGQPIRRPCPPTEPGAFIVAAFGFDRKSALRKIEADMPRIERLALT